MLSWLCFGCSTATTRSGEDGTALEPPCPTVEPAEGSECPKEGVSCHYHGIHTDSLCTRNGKWSARVFDVAAGAPSPTDPTPASYFDCRTQPGCRDDICRAECCTSPSAEGSGPGGCRFCCVNKPCEWFAADACPTSQCALVTDCSGQPTCTELSLTLPACGINGSEASQVACCEGLTPVCGRLSSTGDCAADSAATNLRLELPICVACGDGTCEFPLESSCNCPQDCAR